MRKNIIPEKSKAATQSEIGLRQNIANNKEISPKRNEKKSVNPLPHFLNVSSPQPDTAKGTTKGIATKPIGSVDESLNKNIPNKINVTATILIPNIILLSTENSFIAIIPLPLQKSKKRPNG